MKRPAARAQAIETAADFKHSPAKWWSYERAQENQ